MERTESGWGRAGDSAPRWRSLLDRALLGGRADAAEPEDDEDRRWAQAEPVPRYSGYAPVQAPPAAAPLPARPVSGYPAEQPGYAAVPQYGYRPDLRPAYPPEPAYEPEPAYRPASAPPYEPAPATARAQVPPTSLFAPRRAPADQTEQLLQAMRADLGGPRVLAFANPKGGVHKTTATVLAAATIGSARGSGVLAWDDNELRGTLGLRAGSARHARTIRHLLAHLAEVEVAPPEELPDIVDGYLRHASDGVYDVLAGEENPRFAQRLDPHTVRRVLDILRRTHDVICVDTGNNVESPNWRTILTEADQLVVTTVPREDAAFTADWMLDLLDEAGLGDLVENAVTLLSCPSPVPTPLVDDLSAHFARRTRGVAVVPYDPALEPGSSIDYRLLQPATRQAWVRAAAMMLGV